LKGTITLSERIKALRKEKKMTQLELATKLNITDKAVSKWEAAEGNPDISLLAKLGEIFGVTMDYLLNGKEPEQTIIITSKAELCARNDDVGTLDEIMAASARADKALTDENDLTVFDYALKYKAVKIFKRMSDNYIVRNQRPNLMDARRRVSHSSSIFGAGAFSPANKKEISRMYMLSGCLENLPQLNIPSMSEWTIHDWDEAMLDLAINDDLPKTSQDIIFGMHKQKGENWPIVYSKLMEKAFLENRKSKIDFLYGLISLINDEAFRLSNECLENKKYYIHATNIDPSDKKDEQSIDRRRQFREFFIKTVSAKQQYEYSEVYVPSMGINVIHIYSVTYSKSMLESLLTKDVEILRPFNDNNKKTGGFHFSDKEVEIANMKNKKNHSPDEIFVFSCIEHGILNVEKLLASNSLPLIKQTLDSQPIHYFEVLKRAIEKDDFKKLFKFFVDIGFVKGADEILLEHSYKDALYKHLNRTYNDKVYRRELEKRALQFINNTKRMDSNNFFSEETKAAIAVQEINLAYIAKQFKKVPPYTVLHDIALRNVIVEPEELVLFLNECRKVIVQTISGKVDQQQLELEFNREYFVNRITAGQNDIVIIKLVQLLEGKLKIKHHLSGELNDMIDTYCGKNCYGDDGWGYTVQTDLKTPDLLHRLRIMRNNLVHSETNKVKELSNGELTECVNLVLAL